MGIFDGLQADLEFVKKVMFLQRFFADFRKIYQIGFRLSGECNQTQTCSKGIARARRLLEEANVLLL